MARVSYKEALKAEKVDIEDNFLVVDTIQQGYFNIYKGLHPFKVLKSGEDYAVYPVYWEKHEDKKRMSNGPHPIIRTVDGDVFFVKQTLNDPYNGPDLGKVQSTSKTVEHKVLDAFNVFAQSEFNLGYPEPIHLFITDEKGIGVEDTPVDDFVERDVDGEVIGEEDPVNPEADGDGE